MNLAVLASYLCNLLHYEWLAPKQATWQVQPVRVTEHGLLDPRAWNSSSTSYNGSSRKQPGQNLKSSLSSLITVTAQSFRCCFRIYGKLCASRSDVYNNQHTMICTE